MKLVAVLQTIPEITISGGQPVILFPLFVIVAITAAKDFFEDFKRHRSDREENYRKVKLFNTRSRKFETKPLKDLRVGDIAKVLSHFSSYKRLI